MKRFILVFVITLSVIHISSAQEYQSEITNCDTEYTKSSENDISTVDIITGLDAHVECYKKIVYSVIDSKYSQNATSMKQNFLEYINAAGDATDLMLRPDSCYPQCGTLVSIESATSRRDAARKYLDMLLTPPETF